ncbi:hypothetical protein [Archangium primigenium]|uniref:hypothetical protein n=1 Tax=[Archangium] primigenium TaxID=2792470 RepID=UPI00195DC7E4|nr:hypothetical protein [Archangium primigenium]MBM7112392.1 hypothetical protein [Archangium primigenium]
MGIFGAVVMALTVHAGPLEVKTAPVFNPSLCAKKRVDSCGCHHVYGVRHCHSKRQSEHCESMAQADESPSAHQVDDFLSTLPGTQPAEQTDTATL